MQNSEGGSRPKRIDARGRGVYRSMHTGLASSCLDAVLDITESEVSSAISIWGCLVVENEIRGVVAEDVIDANMVDDDRIGALLFEDGMDINMVRTPRNPCGGRQC
jgi:hypothetical protein